MSNRTTIKAINNNEVLVTRFNDHLDRIITKTYRRSGRSVVVELTNDFGFTVDNTVCSGLNSTGPVLEIDPAQPLIDVIRSENKRMVKQKRRHGA